MGESIRNAVILVILQQSNSNSITSHTHLTSISSPHLTSPHTYLNHLTSPHLTSPGLTPHSPHSLTSPHLASISSPHLASPHQLKCQGFETESVDCPSQLTFISILLYLYFSAVFHDKSKNIRNTAGKSTTTCALSSLSPLTIS